MLDTLNTIYSARFFVNVENKNQLLTLIDRTLTKDTDTHRKRPLVFNYIYLGSLYYAFINKTYLKALMKADYVFLDGFFIGWILRFLYNKKVNRIGSEHYTAALFDYCAKNSYKLFLLGGGEKAVNNIKRAYPSIKIAGLSGFIDLKDNKTIQRINQFQPDVLLVALGLEKQEQWIYLNRDRLEKVKVIIPIGFYGAILGREGNLPPAILDKLNLRWAYKLMKEPKRLWKRYTFGLCALFIVTSYIITIKFLKACTKN